MSISGLSDLGPGNRYFIVHVYVSRLWQHRGASDDGPIKHTDIVFHDKEVLNYVGFCFALFYSLVLTRLLFFTCIRQIICMEKSLGLWLTNSLGGLKKEKSTRLAVYLSAR